MPKTSLPSPLKELREAIQKLPPNIGGDRTKYYTRNTLKLSGDKFKKVRGWFRDPGTLSAEDKAYVELKLGLSPSASVQASASGHSGFGRKLVDHTITLLNSQAIVLASADSVSAEIYDSDRMQIQRAVEKICNTMGLSVTFPKQRASSTPVTRKDIARSATTKEGT